jgi:hypothetical protein
MTVTAPAPRFIDIDGKRFHWRELLQRRREQVAAAPNDGYHPRGRLSPAAPEAALAPHCRRSDARGLAGQVGRSDADEPVRTCTDECCNLIIVYQWAARSPPRAHEPETDTPGIHCFNRRGEGYLAVCGQVRGW